MSRLRLSLTVWGLAAAAVATPATAGGEPAGIRATPQVVSSLSGVELGKTGARLTQGRTLKEVANGSITTATRKLDLDTLKVADFGDEPAPGAR